MDPLLLTVPQTAKIVGCCRSHLYGLMTSGQFGPRPVRLGRKVLFRRDEIERWVAAGCPGREKWLAMQSKAS